MSLPATALDAPLLTVRSDDGVPVVELPSDLPFEALRDLVRERMPSLLPEIGGRAARLDLGDRPIEFFDLRRLLTVLRDEFQVAVTGLYVRPEAIHRFAEREAKLKLFPTERPEPEPEATPEPEAAPEAAEPEAPVDEVVPAEAPTEEPEPERAPATPLDEVPAETPLVLVAPSSRRTQYVERTLRSGASVRSEGDVVVMGDVNPGAQIVAAGNVIVLGALKGMAHAGASGDDGAFILAFDLRPTQLRVGRRIAIPPDRHPDARAEPEIARIVGEHVVIEPYRPRTPR